MFISYQPPRYLARLELMISIMVQYNHMKEASDFLNLAKTQFTDADDYTKIKNALDFATAKHAGQQRLSGEPYIIHPIAVATILMNWNMDRDTVVAGLLHDVAEDTVTDLSEIAEKFGDSVALLVDGVTKISKKPNPAATSYLPRTTDNHTKLLIAIGFDIRVVIIKLADRIHNMRTMQFQSRAKQIKKSRESLQVYGPLADRLNMGLARAEIEDLSFKYLAPKRYSKLLAKRDNYIAEHADSFKRIIEQLSTSLDKVKIDFQINRHTKSIYSLHKKLTRHHNFDTVYDMVVWRIIVKDIPTCYQVLGVVHSLFRPVTGLVKDYIAAPKDNGYQSLHTTVTTPDNLTVEFQIRTEAMHEYDERGLAAYFHYNNRTLASLYKKGGLSILPDNLQWIHSLQIAATNLREGKPINYDALKVKLFSDRVFVYSPAGDVFDLPAGAKPLDFAYQVHSDLAARAAKFKINGKNAKFDTLLKSGDVVEVITRKSIIPQFKWFESITTDRAKTKLRAQLNKLEKK